MADLADLPSSVRECYAAHVVLHAGCGVLMDDIFVVSAIAPDGSGEGVGVSARPSDLPGFDFTVVCGLYGMTREELGRAWLFALPAINAAPPAEREALVAGTWARERAVEILVAYEAKRALHVRGRARG